MNNPFDSIMKAKDAKTRSLEEKQRRKVAQIERLIQEAEDARRSALTRKYGKEAELEALSNRKGLRLPQPIKKRKLSAEVKEADEEIETLTRKITALNKEKNKPPKKSKKRGWMIACAAFLVICSISALAGGDSGGTGGSSTRSPAPSKSEVTVNNEKGGTGQSFLPEGRKGGEKTPSSDSTSQPSYPDIADKTEDSIVADTSDVESEAMITTELEAPVAPAPPSTSEPDPTPSRTTPSTPQPTPLPASEPTPAPEPDPIPSVNYILNKNTYKFHYPWCGDVNKMNEENKQPFYGTRDEVIAMGFKPCGHCHP